MTLPVADKCEHFRAHRRTAALGRLMRARRAVVRNAVEDARRAAREGVPVSESLPAFFAALGIDPRKP